MKILIFIYEFWEIISIASVALGVIGFFYPRIPSTKENSENGSKKEG